MKHNRTKKIAFGRNGNWENLVRSTINADEFSFVCADFADFDLCSVDYAVPINLRDAVILRNRYGNRSAKYLIPAADAMALCADKRIFNETVLAGDFAGMIPPIYRKEARAFPYFLKKRDELSGREIFAVRDLADERQHEARLRSEDYFCQAYAPGRMEYATHMLISNGKVFYHSTNEYEMAEEFAVKGSNLPPIRQSLGITADAGIIDALAGLLAAIGFNGTCCVDYKLVEGRIQLLEVNPRCGFSLFRDINRYLHAYISLLEARRIPAGVLAAGVG